MKSIVQKFSSHVGVHKKGMMRMMTLSSMFSCLSIDSSKVTLCEGSNNDDDDILSKLKSSLIRNIDIDKLGKQVGSQVQEVISTGLPTQLSYGFICGYSSGYALKKVGKAASIVFGLGFATLQTLSYSGYIEINHSRLKEDVEKALDLNRDGNVDGIDVSEGAEKLLKVLQYNMVGGSGFAAGFFGGIRSG